MRILRASLIAIVPVLQTGNDGNKNDDVIGDTFFTNLANGLYAEAAHQDDINDQHAKLTSALDIDFPDLDIQIEIDLTNDLYNQRLLQEEEEIEIEYDLAERIFDDLAVEARLSDAGDGRSQSLGNNSDNDNDGVESYDGGSDSSNAYMVERSVLIQNRNILESFGGEDANAESSPMSDCSTIFNWRGEDDRYVDTSDTVSCSTLE